ncbi:MAG: hypothetical protein AB7F32_02235 [Victivallaceae bacterium]
MRKSFLTFLAILLFYAFSPIPRAEAIDPVTIAILAPLAIKAAEVAKPYVLRGLANGGKHLVTMGADMLQLLLLPWGFIQMTLGLPFGGFAPGLRNVVVGGIAPLKLAFHALLLPVSFFGITAS